MPRKIVESVKTPLAFYTLNLLVAEAVLATLVKNASGTDRTIAIVGMVLLLFLACAAVFVLAWRRPESLALDRELPVADSLEFEGLHQEIVSTLDRLEQQPELLGQYREAGDLARLLDGLYSAVLYASAAVPTGKVEATFFGTLMEWHESSAALRVRYFNGAFNDEVITRAFPLRGPNQGVVSQAVVKGDIEFRNSMQDELKLRGEMRLQALMSFPASWAKTPALHDREVVAVNIGSILPAVFPDPHSREFQLLRDRARALARCLERINALSLAARRAKASHS